MADTQKQTPRELVAFAFVEEEYTKTGDIVRGLMPLFSPLLAKTPNRIFDPKSFAKAVEETYDIPTSPLVAEGLVPKLAEVGLLYRDSKDSQVYRVSPVQAANKPNETINIDSLVAEFVAFTDTSLSPIGVKLEPRQIEEALFQRFKSMQFLSFLEHPDKNYFVGRTLTLKKQAEEEPKKPDIEHALDILCAEFALRLVETAVEKFNLLTKIASGVLIAEVVLTLQSPSSVSGLKGVSAVLDGPLILDFLDLSTPELKEFASDLFQMIDKTGMKKIMFQHTVEEVRGTIHAPLESLQRGEEPYGPLGNRILRSTQHAAYARLVHDRLEEILKEKNIEIVDASAFTTAEYLKHCSIEIEESVRNNIGTLHVSLERRARDALSVATVLRLRGERRHPQSITEAVWVFVTRNAAVAQRSRDHLLYKKQIVPYELPPALTDRQFAGILWFAVGGNLGVLSRKKLIANCAYVVHPRMDIVSKMRQYLSEIDPEKVRLFTALMRDQRAQRTLVHATLGFPALITPGNAEQLLEEIRRSTAAEERMAAQERETELQRGFEERAGLQRAEILEKEAEILRLRNQHNELESAAKSLGRQYNDDIEERVRLAAHSASKLRKWLQILIIALYACIIFSSYIGIGNLWIARGIAAAIAVAGFWIVPRLLFDRLVGWAWRKRLLKKALELRVSDKLDLFEIDPKRGRVTGKSDTSVTLEAAKNDEEK